MRTFLVVLALFASLFSVAQSSDSIFDALNLQEVVVSGTRYAYDRSEAPVVVDVVKPKLLNATQSIVLSEGLSYVPGVRVETNCQNCGFTQVRLNGLEGAYSQILVNNRAIFSALNAVYGLEQIPTNMIEQIEVVRSGGSALYGSNAIAGTINIITKDPQKNTWELRQNLSAIAGDAVDQSSLFNTSVVSKTQTSGATFYGMQRTRDSWDANGDGFTELVQIRSSALGAKAFHRLTEQSKLTADFSWIDEYRRGGDRLDLAPHLTDLTEELAHQTVLGGLNLDFWNKNKRTTGAVYTSFSRTLRDSYYGGLGGGRTAEDSTLARNAYGNTSDLSFVAGAQLVHRLNNQHTLVAGSEFQWNETNDNIEGYQRSIAQTVQTLGLFAQHEWKPNSRFKSLLGARYDLVDISGEYFLASIARSADVRLDALSPRATILYKLNTATQFRGGYSRGFRAPQTFNEDLHISFAGGEPIFAILSDQLTRETSNAFTASLNHTKRYFGGQSSLLVEAFFTQLQNPFVTVSTGATLPNGSIVEEVRNGSSGASVRGLNYEAGWSPNPAFSLQLGGTLQRSTYTELQTLFEPEGEPLPGEFIVSTKRFLRTPNTYGYFNLYYAHGPRMSMDLTGTYTGSMLVPLIVSDSGFLELRESKQFLDINIKVNHDIDFNERLHIESSLGIKNLLNSFQNDFQSGAARDAGYIYGPALPRTFFVSIKFSGKH